MIRALMTLICFVVGGGMGFFLYCFGVAYLVEENLPNPEIAKGFGSRKPVNMINFLLGCGAWKEITGSSHFCKEKHIFLEIIETNSLLFMGINLLFQKYNFIFR